MQAWYALPSNTYNGEFQKCMNYEFDAEKVKLQLKRKEANKMATLIKTDGSKLEIQPQNGLDFQLDELQKFVDGYIEIINLHNGDILVINDNGKDVLDSNETATEIAHKHNAILGWDYICGDVVMCKDEEVQ